LTVLYCDVASAVERLVVASAWLTSQDLAHAVRQSPARSKAVFVNQADITRERGSWQAYAALQEYFAARAHEEATDRAAWDGLHVLGQGGWQTGVMHHKFVLIDTAIVWCGSYNWTYQAQKNYELLLRLSSAAVAQQFWDHVPSLAREASAPPPPVVAQVATLQSMPLSRAEYDLLRLVLHDPALLPQLRDHVTPEEFDEPALRDLYAAVLRLAADHQPHGFPALHEQAERSLHRQLLAQMAVEPVMASAAARQEALTDYLQHFQRRRRQTQLRTLKEQIRAAERRGDGARQQQLLQAYTALSQERGVRHARQ
jgi:hypothetical protein